jgi:serine/threonine protein kinase
MKFTYASGSRPLEGYTIKRGVGHGGFGEVYYAVSDGGKEVALKLVQRNLDVELRGVAQCMNLKHPNLVTLYDLRTNDAGENFVVMEFISGDCLSDVLEAHPQGLPLEHVAQWIRGLCSGIGYLHDKGIVHRDLKPGNVFIEDGVVKIGDYGLSKFITASRRSGQTESVGTVHYMAPEISRGKYDREIDIYAAGIILYEMITGDVPFDGESVGEILMKHLTAQPDVSRLPDPYRHVVLRALAKDPVDRFSSMEQLTGSLNGVLAHAGPMPPKIDVSVPPVPSLQRAALPAGQNAVCSVPFAISSVYEGFAEANGILRFADGELTMQFQVKDSILGAVKSALRDARISPSALESISFTPGWLSHQLVIQCNDMKAISHLPNSKAGRVTLSIARADQGAAERLVSAVHAELPRMRAVSGPRFVYAAADEQGPWLSGKRASLRAWSQQPWRSKDYVLVALGAATVASVWFAPFVAVAGIVLMVLVLMSTSRIPLASSTAPAAPVVLSPPMAAAVAASVAATVAHQTSTNPVPPASAPVPSPVRPAYPPHNGGARDLPPKPARTRLAEGSAAMLLATLLAGVASVLAAGLMQFDKFEECALLAAVTLAGSWAVIVPGKMMEGRTGDPVLRRLTMAAIGLGLGWGATYLDGLLAVGWLSDPQRAPRMFESLGWLPRSLGEASYFGIVFLGPRWWRLADSRRELRFNPWLVIVPGFWAAVVSAFWHGGPHDPEMWRIAATSLVAAVTQLACPWEDTTGRRKAA